MQRKEAIARVQTPCYFIEEALLRKNLELLKSVMDRTGCRVLLAQKAFSMFRAYPLISEYLSGACASGLYEARLAHDYMAGENHIFSPAYREDEFEEILTLCDHIVFNSIGQWKRFRTRALEAGKTCGLRINPECSTQEGHAIYDPCAPGSRLGTTLQNMDESELSGISGLHFHTLCEQDSDALEQTLEAVEEKFGQYLHRMQWINFGGGHHITRPGYDIERLVRLIRHMQETYDLTVYIEPGEAVALNAGFLVSTVLDTMKNGMDIAILDTSAACHMPDVLEMPYRPRIIGAAEPGNLAYTYRLGGPTCLAGDVIGEYSFHTPLLPGDRLVFCDMAIYSMVKNNTFNGMPLPAIYYLRESGELELVRKFTYEDFKNRLS